MTRRDVFPIVCARRGHRVAVVVDDDEGRWLEIAHTPAYGRPRKGIATRVRLSPDDRVDRIGCKSCGRSALVSHRQIADAIGRGVDGMTI